jgi:hypothetical protein
MDIVQRSEFQDDFDQVQVLASKSHLPIGQVYKELQGISQTLQAELIELINNDYKQFISLSYNLSGFDDLISIVREPLDGLLARTEAKSVDLQRIVTEVQQKLTKRRHLDDQIQVLKDCIEVDECISKCSALLESDPDIKTLGRIGVEYNQIEYLLNRNSEQSYLIKARGFHTDLKQKVVGMLEEKLKNSLNDKNTELFEILSIYVMMDVVDNAVQVLDNYVLQPFVDKRLILYKSQIQQMSGHGDIFDKILHFLEIQCLSIHQITLKIKGFPNFLIYSWNYVAQVLMKEFQMLFHVSTPSQFYAAYISSCDFLTKFEGMLEDDIQVYRSSALHKDYSRKWQLSVYFQLMYVVLI